MRDSYCLSFRNITQACFKKIMLLKFLLGIAAPAASCYKMMKMMLLVLFPKQPERFHNLDGSWSCVVKFPALCISVR